jgi:hypothetical protein
VVVVRRDGVELTRWPIPLDGRPDLEVIDELAHVALAARRSAAEVHLEVRCPRLASMIDLVGLRAALGATGP